MGTTQDSTLHAALIRAYRMFVCVCLIALYMIATVPNFLTSIYAEDGKVYLQDAINTGGINNLLKTVAGYADLPARTIAWIVSLFPVALYPYMYALSIVVVMAVCIRVVFNSVKGIFQKDDLALYFSIFLLIIPIARFESVGNVTNLHFFFFTTASIVFINFLYFRFSSFGQLFFVFIAALSVPLCTFLFIFLLFRWKENYTQLLKQPQKFLVSPYFYLFAGTLINFLISWGDTSARSPDKTNTLQKTFYLFMDRVVGSSFVPFWGRVSSENGVATISNSPFQSISLRLFLSILTVIVLLLCIGRLKDENRKIAYFVLFVSAMYSLIIGLFYNLEPRYAIFPSYLLIFTLFLCLSSLKKKLLGFSVLFYLSLMILNANSETESREGVLDWKTQISLASTLCQSKSPITQITFQLAPLNVGTQNSPWILRIPCERIVKGAPLT